VRGAAHGQVVLSAISTRGHGGLPARCDAVAGGARRRNAVERRHVDAAQGPDDLGAARSEEVGRVPHRRRDGRGRVPGVHRARDVSARWQALNSNQLGTSLLLGAPLVEGAVYMGQIDGFNIFVYAGWYINEADVENEIHPSNWITMSAPAAVEGVRAFGAIKDVEQPIEAEYYVKSYTEPDPSARYLLMQSAPLMVPVRPNASLGVKVL
jgi:hypothetical protein